MLDENPDFIFGPRITDEVAALDAKGGIRFLHGGLQMLQWTAAGKGRRFALYVHHTDGEREWTYDRDSHIGRLDKGLDEAAARGWTVVDMKQDWKRIHPFEKP